MMEHRNPRNDEGLDAYNAGWDAFEAGSVRSNPHTDGTILYKEWDLGFEDAANS